MSRGSRSRVLKLRALGLLGFRARRGSLEEASRRFRRVTSGHMGFLFSPGGGGGGWGSGI